MDKNKERPPSRLDVALPYILIICGLLGLFAAFVLTQEKMSLLKDPNFVPSCNINPILSCGSVIRTKQAQTFGFPNPYLGLVGFASVITIGMAMIAGAKFKRWFWRGLEIGTLLGILFTHWLTYHSIYRIKALCVYCMLVWVVTITAFVYVTLYNLRHNYIPTPKSLQKTVNFAQKHHADIVIAWCLIILLLILNHFWYYWKTII